jgi:hypothetical protein
MSEELRAGRADGKGEDIRGYDSSADYANLPGDISALRGLLWLVLAFEFKLMVGR